MVLNVNANASIGPYIAWTFAVRTVATAVGLVVLIQSLDLIGQSNAILAAPGATEAALLLYVKLRLPILMSQFLPFAVLVSSLATLAAMAHTNQIVIMKSSGRSPHQILAPLVAIAAVAAALHLVVDEILVVDATRDLDAWQRTRYGADPPPPADEREDVWLDAGGRVVHASRITRANGVVSLSDILMFTHERDGRLQTVATAESGEVSGANGTLRNVREIQLDVKGAKVRAEKPWQTGVEPDRFFDGPTVTAHLGAGELMRRIDDADDAGREASPLRAALYQRLAWPLASLVMPLLAAIAGFAKGRNDFLALRIAAGLALGFSYFVVESLTMALGRAGTLPPVVGAFLPLVLYLVIAEYILLRSEH